MAKYTLGANELSAKSHNLWKSILAEFIGIFILNFFSCAACTQSQGDLTLIALAFGLSVFMAAMVSGDVLTDTHHNWEWRNAVGLFKLEVYCDNLKSTTRNSD